MQTKLRLGGAVAALALTVAGAAAARAEIDPRYYRQWQDRASEALVVRIDSVRTSVGSESRGGGTLVHTRIEAAATVQSVTRSLTKLKPGDRIRIQYVNTRANAEMVGPRPIPVIKAGQSYPAFLFGISPGVYGPAARGASFEPLIETK